MKYLAEYFPSALDRNYSKSLTATITTALTQLTEVRNLGRFELRFAFPQKPSQKGVSGLLT